MPCLRRAQVHYDGIMANMKRCAQLLLASGGDPTLANEQGRTALDFHADHSEDASVFPAELEAYCSSLVLRDFGLHFCERTRFRVVLLDLPGVGRCLIREGGISHLRDAAVYHHRHPA